MKIGRSGFTLIEAIVAIALIGIIAVGMIPAFAAQFKMTVESRDITMIGFDAQGAIEDDINAFKVLLKEDGLYSGPSPAEPFAIFGRVDIPLFQVSKEFPLNENKSFIVFLSEKLAEMEYRDPLVASLVRIDGEADSGLKTEGIEVASVRSSSDLKHVKGTFAIVDYTSTQDLNLYRWYRSEEGFSDPKFPDNYELVEEWRNKKSLTKDDLKKYAANRYLMLSLIPVDKSGVRGDEKPSVNRVYIQGEEWRSGIFAWVDKNTDSSYDTANDVEVKYSEGARSSWPLLIGFNSQKTFPKPGEPEKRLDPSDGSLYVPMGVERSQNSDRVGEIDVTESVEFIDWSVDKSIHFANEISVRNHSDIRMKTTEGSITIYQYADINTANGEAKYGSNGKVLLYPDGAKLISDRNIILKAGGKWGSINLEPYSALEAVNNIELTAEEYIVINGSNLEANENIVIESKKKDITIEDTEISAAQLILKSNSKIIGGSWNAGTSVIVSDGKVLTIEAGTSQVDNTGPIILGNTGGIVFDKGMDADLKNPLNISLAKKSSDEIKISTTYGRNVGYAGENSTYEGISEPGSYQSLGTGQTNLSYTVLNLSGSGSPTLNYSFDGTNTLSINASGAEEKGYANYYELKVKDKYVEEVTGSIRFVVSAMDGESPSVEIIAPEEAIYTVTFDSNGGTPAVPSSIAVGAGEAIGPLPQPSLAGHEFAGWNSEKNGSGSVFIETAVITRNMTVYAQFSTIPIDTVTFHKNGGNTEANPMTRNVMRGTAIGTLPQPPTRIGYLFQSWNTLANGNGTLVDELTIVTGDLTAYAKWVNKVKFADMSIGAYVSINEVIFQKISNTRLLTRNYVGSNGIWSTVNTRATNFRINFFNNISWITGSGLVEGEILNTMSGIEAQRTVILAIPSTSWWGGQSSSTQAFRVDGGGLVAVRDKTGQNRSCRPYITVNNSDLYVNSGSGTLASPYILIWEK